MVPWWTLLLASLSPLASLAVGVAMVLTNRRGQNIEHADHVAELEQKGAVTMQSLALAAPTIDLTAAEEWIYVSPRDDVKSVYLHFISLAQRSIHISIFGFHIPELTDALIAAHQRGVLVDLILDHSQAQGRAEAAEIARLMDAGVPFLIGTSPEQGQLLHAKITIIDEEWVEEGSWNYSESATAQFNTARITHSPQLANIYLLERDRIRAYIIRHESIFQPRREVTPAPALTADIGQDAQLDPNPDGGQVHRKDVAAPWLDNQPLPPPVSVSAPASPVEKIAAAVRAKRPSTRKRAMAAAAS